MSDRKEFADHNPAREKFLGLSLKSTRKSYFPQLQQHLESAEENERRLRLLIDNMPARISYVDFKEKYVIVNIEHEKVFGLTSEQIVGKKIETILGSENYKKIKQHIHTALSGEKVRYETSFTCRNGEKKWLEVNYVPDVNPSGKVLGFYDLTIDLTEKVNALTLAAENRQFALVGQIAGKMAHDFNNVLGVIMGNTELSLLDCRDEEIKKTLELILEQTIRGKNLTRNLVAFAKDQEPKQEFFKAREKIDLVLNLLKKDLENIEVIREDRPGVPDLLADPGMIEHAFVNLLQNSIHALSKNDTPRIILRTYSNENDICFEIEDNGCGIPEEHVENIFDPSFTLKGLKDVTGSYKADIKGSGYGMANVKKYIEQHNGTIFFDSSFKSGARFIIKIPIVEKGLTREEKVKVKKENVIYEKYILLVEDEPAISDVQYRILTQEPCYHRVDIANNGEIAIDLFKRNEYDFVSLDYILPGPINGKNVYEHIRKTDKDIPILFISGNIEFLESIKELKKQDKNIEHLPKPCRNIDYVNSINRLLKRTVN